jgi:hypothetical protein
VKRKPPSNGVWGPRDQKDPTSREYAIQTVRALKQYLEASDIDEDRVREELARIDRYRHWKVLGHKSKAEMLEAEGLAERLRKIRRRVKKLEGKTINAADNHNPNPSPDIIRTSETGHGTSADYLTARLKRDHDAIFQRLAAGQFSSVRQAAIAAGIVKVPSVLDQLRKLWTKASEADRRTFMDEVSRGR